MEFTLGTSMAGLLFIRQIVMDIGFRILHVLSSVQESHT